MGVYSNTAANAYADKIKAVYEYLDEIKKVADRLTPVEDLTSFRAQIEDLHTHLDLLVEASSAILSATPTGKAILAGTVESIRTLLGIGVLPDDLVRRAELEAALAALEQDLLAQMGQLNNQVSAIQITTDQLDQYRLVQQTQMDGLQISYNNLLTGQQTNQSNTEMLLSRLLIQEDKMVLVDQNLATIHQNVADTVNGLQATNNVVSGHTSSISTLGDSIALHNASIDQLSSDLVLSNSNIAAHASAIEQLQTSITGVGNDLTAQASQTTSLKSVIGGSGNLLPNADFGASSSGWEIVAAEEDWANTVLTVDTFNMPSEVHCLEVLGQPTPLGQIVVRSPVMLVEANHHYMVSGYPCVDNGTVSLSYKVFNNAGQLLGQDQCPAVFNPTTNPNFDAYTRTWIKFLAPAGATKLYLYLTVTGDGDFTTQGALFRPMVERSWAEQSQPSAWTPNVSGSIEALEGAVHIVESALTQEIITSANKNAAFAASINNLSSRMLDAEGDIITNATALSSLTTRVTNNEGTLSSQSTQLTNLQAQVNAIDADTGGSGAAISALDTRVTAVEGDIDSMSQDITVLQNSVTSANKVFVQNTAPPTTGRTVNDLWIHTGEANKPYFFDGTNWVARPDNAKNKVFYQSTAPTATAVNDLWVKSSDNNKLFRWNGSSWVDITDARISANSTAISNLTSRVTTAEGTITSQGSAITALQNTVNNPTTGLGATADAVSSLDTRVTSAENTISSQSSSITALQSSVGAKTTTFVQGTQPSSTGRVVGDTWIDTANNNRVSTWSGSAWVVRNLEAGITVFAQAAQPSTSGRRVGDLWYDTDNNNKMYRWGGSGWVSMEDPRTGSHATAINSLTTRVSDAEGDIQAQASSLQSLTTTVNGNTATISQHASSINGLKSLWSVQLDVNNYISGLYAENNGTLSSVKFRSDVFQIVPSTPSGERLEWSSNNLRIYDSSGVMRVRLGVF